MIEEIEALKILFDRKSSEINTVTDIWSIYEKSDSANLSQLDIMRDGCEFYEIRNPFYQGISNTTTERSSILKDYDSDGACCAIIDGVKHYIFVDLKSTFSIQHISKALLQNLHTFLKLHPMLSLCKGYSANGYVVDFIVACQTFKDEAQESGVLKIISDAIMLEEPSFVKDILNPLLMTGNHIFTCKIGTLSAVDGLPFHSSIKDTEVRIHLVMTNNFGDTKATYKLN